MSAVFTPSPIRRNTSSSRSARASAGERVSVCRPAPTARCSTPAGGTVTFQAGVSGTITLTTGELAISKNLTIAGPGAGVITVSGNHASRVFDIAATYSVGISRVMISDGNGQLRDGGGIENHGRPTVTDSIISGNSTYGYGDGTAR